MNPRGKQQPILCRKEAVCTMIMGAAPPVHPKSRQRTPLHQAGWYQGGILRVTWLQRAVSLKSKCMGWSESYLVGWYIEGTE